VNSNTDVVQSKVFLDPFLEDYLRMGEILGSLSSPPPPKKEVFGSIFQEGLEDALNSPHM
jgi:hypothetical protein